MNCPNCGKQIPDTAKVCGYCGTRLQVPIPPKPRPEPPRPASAPDTELVAPPPAPQVATRTEPSPTPPPEGAPRPIQPVEKPPPEAATRARQPSPATAAPTPKQHVRRKIKISGRTWGVIGGIFLLAVFLALGLTGTVFVPYLTLPPAPVRETLAGARMTYYNAFNQLPTSKFEYNTRYTDLSGGVAQLGGNDYDWPYIAYMIHSGIQEGHAILISFKYSTGADWTLSFVSGYFGSPDHRAWGIYQDLQKYAVKNSEWFGVEGVPGNLSLVPNTWYSLLLAVDEGPEFMAYLWERDRPDRSARITRSLSGDQWEGRNWVFTMACSDGWLIVDELAEIRFDHLK